MNYDRLLGEPILEATCAGRDATALDAQTEEQRVAWALRALRDALGGQVPEPTRARDPAIEGCVKCWSSRVGGD